MSLEEEITQFLEREMKGSPAALEMAVNDAKEFPLEQAVVTLIIISRSLQESVIRLAREIDELRAT